MNDSLLMQTAHLLLLAHTHTTCLLTPSHTFPHSPHSFSHTFPHYLTLPPCLNPALPETPKNPTLPANVINHSLLVQKAHLHP